MPVNAHTNYGIIRVTVPVDFRLENQCRRWAKSNNPELRALGATQIQFFRSGEDIRVVHRLLDDSGTLEIDYVGSGKNEKIRVVRNASIDTLDQW